MLIYYFMLMGKIFKSEKSICYKKFLDKDYCYFVFVLLRYGQVVQRKKFELLDNNYFS